MKSGPFEYRCSGWRDKYFDHSCQVVVLINRPRRESYRFPSYLYCDALMASINFLLIVSYEQGGKRKAEYCGVHWKRPGSNSGLVRYQTITWSYNSLLRFWQTLLWKIRTMQKKINVSIVTNSTLVGSKKKSSRNLSLAAWYLYCYYWHLQIKLSS